MLPIMLLKSRRILSAARTALTIVVLPTVLSAQAPHAENTSPPRNGNASAGSDEKVARPLTPADKKFMKEASEILYVELATLEIALRRNRPVGASPDAAKKLGDRLHPDVKKIWEELSSFADAKNEKLRAELVGIDRREVEKLRSLDIEKFNKHVVSLLVKETKKLAQLFDSKATNHPVLDEFAARHLPKIKKHVEDVLQAAK